MEINKKIVIEKYNGLEKIWSDKWHSRTFHEIQKFILTHVSNLDCVNGRILNAGSAGYGYDLPESNMIHLDIANEKISHLYNGVHGSIEAIPYEEKSFDLIVCVGSVINYNDPMVVFREFKRVLKPGGSLVVEFENSNTLELIFTSRYNKNAVLVNTFYFGPEPLWYYSDNWIKEICKLNGFELTKSYKFHFLSPLVYRLVKDENTAGPFIWADCFFRIIPGIKDISSNTIYLLTMKP